MKTFPRFKFSDFPTDFPPEGLVDPVVEIQEEDKAQDTVTGADNVIRTITAQDVEASNKQGYDKGYQEATVHFEAKIAEMKKHYNIHDQLHEGLVKIVQDDNVFEQKASMIKDIVVETVNSLALRLPVDIEQLIHQKILPLVRKNLTDGEIIIKLHPSNVEECNAVIMKEKLPNELQDKVRIIAEEGYDKDQCQVVCADTNFSYSRKSLVQEIKDIVQQFVDVKSE